ncbi:TPA: hypothetical protein U2Q83_004234 [Enterobacter hormaechei]|uniref:hypothetical protein n=1 Tax=Enterobacter hormaechei TaxID=158836 RepID=UPI0022AD013F|nr:hypothetical protein [Enterobacter hormaechei]EKG3230965.1 hypothetical protein [Enterobacter hormaechei]MDS0952171.1 hypothetical protein [Enterobacter hormaechei]MDX7178983.1 hypothetical protein [Enterobacter hormaechei]MED5639967.1 hypothetical protein [Enterobacter hormaechei]HCU0621565.1 hypothetical protein [Enterobacter hormaechei]
MITEKDNVFYCDCGFSFERGRSGYHECVDCLRRKLESFRTAFMEYSEKTDWMQADKRFDVIKPLGKHRADVLKEYIEHLESRLLAGESGFPPLTVERLTREKDALEKRVVELEARMVKLPERYEVDMCPTPSPNGEWFSREDVLAALVSADVSYAAGNGKGE